ncbi:MAG: fumarylacetoacetate hydrolase [Rhodospirillaceae bacterium]|nr:fumarylacetoacetate hydrolase [Rhodospirillaceae bacterium]|tara:strand:+ start:1767 stop:2552 length:786 start_codon:yes stop_codon:yes gene_type:complete
MKNTDKTSRRQFLSGSAAAAAAACVSRDASAQDADYVIDPPNIVSMEIDGSDERFPVRRVFCLGRNYRAHAYESGDDPDVNPPFFFIKPRDAITDSREGHPYPSVTRALRYEGELVVALQSGGTNIDPADALDHVYAYGVGLDMTRQDLQQEAQRLSRPWAISKSFDNSAPCGPLYPVETNGHAVTGRIWLSVNGEVKQDSDLSFQIWSVSEGIAILSRHYELKAGDIIMTGTPEGIGLVETGDVVRVGIDGLGEIEVNIT